MNIDDKNLKTVSQIPEPDHDSIELNVTQLLQDQALENARLRSRLVAIDAKCKALDKKCERLIKMVVDANSKLNR